MRGHTTESRPTGRSIHRRRKLSIGSPKVLGAMKTRWEKNAAERQEQKPGRKVCARVLGQRPQKEGDQPTGHGQI